MTKLHRIAALTGLAVLISMIVAGSAFAQSATSQPSTAASTSADKVVFSYGTDSDITSLNIWKLCCGPDYTYMTLVYDTAFGYGDDLKVAPSIITSWTPNEDSTVWTLKIRDDATFNDGTPVTAEDVAFSFAVVADNDMPTYKNYLPFNPTFEVIDATTVEWQSEEPTYAPIVPAYIPIIPQHVWEPLVVPGDADATRKAFKEYPNEQPVGSGPFTLTEYNQKQLLRFEVRDDYWDGQPKSVQEVDIRIYSNQEAMTSALKAGEIDFAYGLTPDLWDSPTVQNDPNITPHALDGGCWSNIAWNFGGQSPEASADPIINDKQFRQAMSMAINRQEIVSKVYSDRFEVGYSILMPGKNGAWYHEIPPELRYDYDPEAAKAMLDDIGVVDTNGDGLREAPGTKENIDLEMMSVSDVQGSVDTGKVLAGYFEQVGIGSTPFVVDEGRAVDLWYSGDWDAYVWDWCPDPDPDFMLSVFTTDECLSWSDGCWSNKEYDDLYRLQQTQLNRDERQQTVNQMQEMIAEEIPTMVLNYWTILEAYRNDRFTGYLTSPAVEDGDLIFGWNNKSLFNLELVAGASSGKASSGLPAWAWIALMVGIVVIFGIVVGTRRKKEDEEVA